MQIEVARSFGYKLNVGNYETRDFFCFCKATEELEDANPELLGRLSKTLFAFCQQQVRNDVAEYKRAMLAAKTQPKPG
jgi:hypothetical protein